MSVSIHINNDLEELANKIELTNDNPLRPSVFVTQTDGIKHWISLYLAKKEGIFTNFQFFKPNSFINDVAFRLRTGNPGAYNNANLRWWLFQLLEEKEFKIFFPSVANYYEGDELRRIQLACKVADLFDQYIVYRYEMMLSWNSEKYNPENYEKWQNYLWRKIKASIEKEDPEAIDKATYKEVIQRSLLENDNGEKLRKIYPVVHVFGLSIMTKFHLDLFRSFSEHIDMRFYLLNPAPEEYWYDTVSTKELAKTWAKRNTRFEVEEMSEGNFLLTSWGKAGQELFAEIFEIDDSFINAVETGYTPRDKGTLLSTLQTDINHNLLLDQTEPITKKLVADDSIAITSNYTPAREVEVLYDYLVKTIDEKYQGENIEPQDIVVMVPNINEYVPYIRTVFDTAPHRLPYTIGDQPLNDAHTITNLILTVLGITEQEFTSENVLKLLEFEDILNQYQISDTKLIRQAVDECNIRFGIKGDTTTETHLVSWSQGLRRIVFGIAMRDEAFEEEDTVLPYHFAEGQNALELLNFVRFVDDLIKIVKVAHQERTLSSWAQYVLRITETFVLEKSQNEEQFNLLRTELEDLLDTNETFKELKISFQVFYFIFKDFHLNETQKEGYFRGRITFCTALPMRSIPFKVIAFLGLNGDAFPRKENKLGFDIIQNGKRQRGDRDVKMNDRYLFLEAFLSAQDHLYLSYIGRSIKDNSKKTPSVVLEELLDYIAKRSDLKLEEVENSLIKEHPLNGYSNLYLQKSSGLSTYFPINKAGDKVLSQSQEALPEKEKITEIELKDLINFYKNPAKWYFNKHVGVYFFEEDTSVSETEVFEIERGLHEHYIKNSLLDIEASNISDFVATEKKKGNLPLGNMGTVLTQQQFDDSIQVVQDKIKAFKEGKTESTKAYEIKIDGIRLYSNEIITFDQSIYSTCFSKTKTNYQFELFLKHLLLRACNEECNALLITPDTDFEIDSEKTSSEEAKMKLAELIHIFMEHQEKLLPYFPKLATNIVEKQLKGKETDIHKELKADFGRPSLLQQNEYLNASYAHSEVWQQEDAEKYAQLILQPMIEIITEKGDEA